MGRSPDRENPQREVLLGGFGLNPRECVTQQQVHSRDIVVIAGDDRRLVSEEGGERSLAAGELAEADGIIVSGGDQSEQGPYRRSGAELTGSFGRKASRGASIGVTVADCLPLFLVDPRGGSVALLHSGWKGTGILSRAVELMVARCGSRPPELELLIGPGIGSCCYEVDRERATGFAELFGRESVAERNGSCYLDLPAANRGLASAAGIGVVRWIRSCTHCTAAYHSYRRDGAEQYGHMLAFCAV